MISPEATSLIYSSMTCDEGMIIYKGRIIATNERISSDLISNLDSWVSTEPVLVVGGEELKAVGGSPSNHSSMADTGDSSILNLQPVPQAAAGTCSHDCTQ